MKLINKLVMVMTILLFITIHHTYSKQEKPAVTSKYPSLRVKDTNITIDHFSPSDIILVKLP